MAKLDDIRKNKLLEELKRRTAKKWVLEEIVFDKQLALINDPARFKTAVCSRRAGKSVACAADLLNTAITKPDQSLLYVTLTRTTAKKLVWREVEKLNRIYNLGGLANNTDLTFTFPNNSIIYFSGCAYEDEIEKMRGPKYHKVYIDEAQSFKPFIEFMIEDVITPAMWDTNGTIVLIGTPGPIPSGYFFRAAHSSEWSNFKWTLLNNPHIKLQTGRDPEDILAEERKRKGINESTPSYMREALGLWVQDNDSLVYKYDSRINHYDALPDDNLTYIFGIDLGYVDSDSIAVLGYSSVENKVYLVEEFLKNKLTITELSKEISRLKSKYNPIKMMVDGGGLGKKIVEELRPRFGQHFVSTDKTRKHEFIELLNDDLRTGRLMIKASSHAANDYAMIQWDLVTKDRRKISDSFHSDIADAVLYAWRECRHYYAEKPVVLNNDANALMQRIWDKEDREWKRKKDEERFFGKDDY